MTDSTPPAGEAAAEHPAVTVAEKLAQSVARHVMAARQAVAEPEQAARQQRLESVLQEMHDEGATILGPMVEAMLEHLPEDHPYRPIVEGMKSPDNILLDILLQALGFVGFIMGGIGTIGSILLQGYKNEFLSKYPNVPLSPADLANMVVQGYKTMPEGQAEALFSGVDQDRFSSLVDVTGMPPSPQDLFEMFRRGIIAQGSIGSTDNTVKSGLAQGHTKDVWIDDFAKLAYVRPTAVDFVAAAVREQIDYATAAQWAKSVGLDFSVDIQNPPTQIGEADDTGPYPSRTFFDLLFDVAGRPAAPGEAADMAWRDIIPWTGTGPHATTFQQAIAESDLKTKWTESLRKFSAWRPTVTEVGMMYTAGVIDESTADKLWTWAHVDSSLLPLVRSLYTLEAVRPERETAKGNVVQLYLQGALSDAEATSELEALGFAKPVVAYLLRYAQYQRLQTQLARLLEQIGRSVIAGKVSTTDAVKHLEKFGIPEAEAAGLLQEWETAKALSVPDLTAAQIASAVYYGVETPDDGMFDLLALGYTPYNAWRMLSLRLHAPIPQSAIPNHPGATHRPGTPTTPAGGGPTPGEQAVSAASAALTTAVSLLSSASYALSLGGLTTGTSDLTAATSDLELAQQLLQPVGVPPPSAVPPAVSTDVADAVAHLRAVESALSSSTNPAAANVLTDVRQAIAALGQVH